MTTSTVTEVHKPRRRRRLRLSPVARRELQDRWRGGRAGWVVTFYVAALSALMMLLYFVADSATNNDFAMVSEVGVGRFMFENLIAVQLGLALFVGAGYAAGQISSERERRTLGLLQVTLLSPMQIVLGKLRAVAAWQGLLLLLGAPLAAGAFFFGGVSVADLLASTLYMIVVSLAISALAIAVSSFMRRSSSAIIVTYTMLLFVLFGLGLVAIAEALITQDIPFVSLYMHPFTGLAAAADAGFSGSLPSLLTPFAALLAAREGGDMFLEPDPQASTTWIWVSQMLVWVGLAVIGLLIAGRRVRPGHGPRRKTSSAPTTAGVGMPVGGTAVPPAPVMSPPPATGQ